MLAFLIDTTGFSGARDMWPENKKKVKKNNNNIEEVLVVSISATGKTVGPGRIAYFQCMGWLAGWHI